MTAFLACLALSPILILGLQAFLVRIFQAAGLPALPQAVAALALLLGAAINAGLVWLLYIGGLRYPGELAAAWSYAALVYGGLGYSYFHLFNISQTSRRLRILYELHAAGPTTPQALEGLYSPVDQLRNRLERLLALGQIRQEGEKYVLDGFSLLHLAARGLSLWARLLGLRL